MNTHALIPIEELERLQKVYYDEHMICSKNPHLIQRSTVYNEKANVIKDLLGNVKTIKVDLSEAWDDVENIRQKIDDELTSGMVRDGQSYSSCFPSETSYCSGVERGMERLIEEIQQKYWLMPKVPEDSIK